MILRLGAGAGALSSEPGCAGGIGALGEVELVFSDGLISKSAVRVIERVTSCLGKSY